MRLGHCASPITNRAHLRRRRKALEALQRQVEAQLELRRNLDELKVALEGIDTLSSLIPYCSTCQLNIVIPADAAAIAKVSAGVKELLTSKQWPEEDVAEVQLAVQEALANAIHHGCKDDLSKQVQCCVAIDAKGEVVIVVRDPGPGFDVKDVPDPRDGDNVLKQSGRGVFLINQLMDSVEFTEEGRQVRMRKRADAKAGSGSGG